MCGKLFALTPKFYAWRVGPSVRVPTQRRNFRGGNAETGTIQSEKCCPAASRFQPLSAAWQKEVPPRKPEAPAGPLTHPRAHEWPLPEKSALQARRHFAE